MATKARNSAFLMFGGLVATLHAVLLQMGKLPQDIPATKPFGSFDEFYPFYISQHQDETCRRLHFIGTSIIIFFALIEPRIFVSLGLASVIGVSAFGATRSFSHGLFEGLIMLLTFALSMKIGTGSWVKALSVPAVAYTFAWVGHFFFEMNRPATFVYPVYSLLGDFKLWAEIATAARNF